MKLHRRNDLTARNVLTNVQRIAKASHSDRELCLEVYANGREQGFALSDWCEPNARKVAWSEFRRSDQIVVYYGPRVDFEHNTNIPSDAVYENAKFFACGEYNKAAKFIVKYLEG
jgi:hypothetical protein